MSAMFSRALFLFVVVVSTRALDERACRFDSRLSQCFGLPENCFETGSCQVVLSLDNDVDGARFRLAYEAAPNSYASVGLSSDQFMGDDHVTDCITKDGQVRVAHSFNEGHRNRLTDDRVSDATTSLEDRTATCEWSRAVLNSTTHILLATGLLSDGLKQQHEQRLALSLSEGKAVSRHWLVSLHGVCQSFAWPALLSSVVAARAFKQSFEGWFVLHRTVNSACIALILVAQTAIFSFAGLSFGLHQFLGFMAVLLSFGNAAAGFFRPDKEAPQRPRFNLLHTIGGHSATLFALLALSTAPRLAHARLSTWFCTLPIILLASHSSLLLYLRNKQTPAFSIWTVYAVLCLALAVVMASTLVATE